MTRARTNPEHVADTVVQLAHALHSNDNLSPYDFGLTLRLH